MNRICNGWFQGFGTGLTLGWPKAMKRPDHSGSCLGNRLTVGLTTTPLSHCNSTTSFVTHSLEKARKSLFPLAICNAFFAPTSFLGRL